MDELRRRAWLLVFTVFVSTPLFAQTPASAPENAAPFDAILDRPAFENAFWGALVVDVQTGDTLFARNARKSFVPASNTKLYTTAAALDQLGPDFRYQTRLFAGGTIAGGTLRGSLVVQGSGDPVIGGRFNGGDLTEVFRDWARALRAAGITRVTGDVIGDDDAFDDERLGYGWNWDDETYWYSAQLGALAFNDNCVDVTIRGRRAGAPATVRWEPANTTYVQMINRTHTRPAGFGIEEGYRRERGTNRIVLTSEVGAGTTDTESLSVENPTGYFVYVLRDVLRQEGIRVDGEARDVDDLDEKPDYGRLREIAVHTSPPLADIVGVVNKQSQNLYADQLLKTLGTRPAPVDTTLEVGSAARGVAVERLTFARAGLDTARVHLVDGSGLSRSNWITPAMTVALLRFMAAHPDAATREAFYASLPIGGVDGTLRGRFGSGPAHENVRAKTGSLGGVSSLSGFVTTADGRRLAFSLMCNLYVSSTRDVREAQDDFVNALAALRQ